jgi:hypothetical protein
VGKSMIRPLLSRERLSLDERTGRAGYRYGQRAKGVERMDDLEFIAAGLITVAVALLSVIYQTMKAALANPVRSLRYEYHRF